MLGKFDFSDEKLQDTIGVLPAKKQIEIIPENLEALPNPYIPDIHGYRTHEAIPLDPTDELPKVQYSRSGYGFHNDAFGSRPQG